MARRRPFLQLAEPEAPGRQINLDVPLTNRSETPYDGTVLPSPSAVLLDLDGTLLDTQVGLDAGITAALQHALQHLNVDEAQWRGANGAAATKVWSTKGEDWVLGRVADADIATTIYAETLSLVGHAATLAPVLASVHRAAVNTAARAYDDAQVLLAALRRHQVPVGIVTNGETSQRDLVASAGIDVPAHRVIVSAEHGRAKPDASLFDTALAALGADHAKAWHVGDSLSTDVAGARAAGIPAVWIDRSGQSLSLDGPSPDLRIATLDELVTQIDN